MIFATPKFNKAVEDYKNNFGTHKQMFQYGQFYVTSKTIDDIELRIENVLRANTRFTIEPQKLDSALKFFHEKLKPDVRQIQVSVILAMIDLLEKQGDMADIRLLFKPTDADAKRAEVDFNQLWSTPNIPSAPYWFGDEPTIGKARAAHKLEKDRCFQVSRSMAKKLATKHGTTLPSAVVISDGQLAGAKPQDFVPAAPHDVGQQIIRHDNPGALATAYARMKATIDKGGFVQCGVLSGARGPFPEPEHYLLAFAYDVIDGSDAFLFWDPDGARSNIASTSPGAGKPGWGPGFGVLFANSKRLSTAVNDTDLTAIDRDKDSPFFGDHNTETRRHCYQVYYVQSLPLASSVRIHTKVTATPKHTSVDTMLHNATTLFASYGVDLVEVSREDLIADDLVDRFRTLYIGSPGQVTAELTDLHDTLRSPAGVGEPPRPTEVLVAVVDHLVPAALGSPASPPDKPGTVIAASSARKWTLAHQLGHLLGLDDVADTTNLMCNSTAALTADPPQLTASDVTAISSSLLAQDG